MSNSATLTLSLNSPILAPDGSSVLFALPIDIRCSDELDPLYLCSEFVTRLRDGKWTATAELNTRTFVSL